MLISMLKIATPCWRWPTPKTLQTKLLAEMKGRIKEDDSSVPSPDGPHALFQPLQRGRPASAVLPRTAWRGGPDQVLLDGDVLAKGKIVLLGFGDAQHRPIQT